MNDRECLRTSTNVWRSLCDHCELMAYCIRKPIRHIFATGETSITFETPQNDRECLRTATNVWRSFAIITNSWRTAFVSPFAIYSPQCETSIRIIVDENASVFLYITFRIQCSLPVGASTGFSGIHEFSMLHKRGCAKECNNHRAIANASGDSQVEWATSNNFKIRNTYIQNIYIYIVGWHRRHTWKSSTYEKF